VVLSKEESQEHWAQRKIPSHTTEEVEDQTSLQPDSVVEERLLEQENPHIIIKKLLTKEERKKKEIYEIRERLK